jgi:hypothetical protein
VNYLETPKNTISLADSNSRFAQQVREEIEGKCGPKTSKCIYTPRQKFTFSGRGRKAAEGWIEGWAGDSRLTIYEVGWKAEEIHGVQLEALGVGRQISRDG